LALRGDPAASPPLLVVTLVFAVAFGWLELLWLRAAVRRGEG
jgi:hypothetical protein